MPPIQSRFPRISWYGFLSDCHTGALVSPEGSIEWLCLPRFDSESVFGSLLDRSAGFWRIGPPGLIAPVSRRYVPGTNVLETTWMTGSGWVIIRDGLTLGDWRPGQRLRAPPAPTAGRRGRARPDPADRVPPGRGRHRDDLPAGLRLRGDAARIGERRGDDGTDAEVSHENIHLILTGDLPIGVDGSDARARHRMKAGEVRYQRAQLGTLADTAEVGRGVRAAPAAHGRLLAPLARGRQLPGPPLARLPAALGPGPQGPHLRADRRPDRGAHHLPARDPRRRAQLGLPLHLDPRRHLHPLGDAHPRASTTRRRTSWAGWRTSTRRTCRRPRPGCRSCTGSAASRTSPRRPSTTSAATRAPSPSASEMPPTTSDRTTSTARCSTRSTSTPRSRTTFPTSSGRRSAVRSSRRSRSGRSPTRGSGRGAASPKHYVSSKLMCWVALDRGCRLADRIGDEDRLERWSEVAEADPRATSSRRGSPTAASSASTTSTDALDASTLLVPLVRFLPPDDERVVNTVKAIDEELTENGLVLRYRVDETDDGLHGEEAQFPDLLLLARLRPIRDRGAAERPARCARGCSACAGPLGLYAEELDARTGRHWGNFPQAFTHLALINAVSHVITRRPGDRRPRAARAVLSEMISQQTE